MILERPRLAPGQRPPGVLLLHGLGGTPIELGTLARALENAGCLVHCPRLAGHCGTADELRATTWRDWYASAESGLADLLPRCGSVVVGGLSMGALLAARLARENPDRVHGLAMLAPTFWYDGWAIPRYSFLLKWLMRTPIGRNYSFVETEPYGLKDERIRRKVLGAMQRGESANAGLMATPAQALQQMWALSADVRRGLGSIGQETLLVHSRDDDVASLRNAFEVQSRLGGRVDAVILEDSYHLITIDRQRGLLGRRMAEFVRQIHDRHGPAPEGAPASLADAI